MKRRGFLGGLAGFAGLIATLKAGKVEAIEPEPIIIEPLEDEPEPITKNIGGKPHICLWTTDSKCPEFWMPLEDWQENERKLKEIRDRPLPHMPFELR